MRFSEEDKKKTLDRYSNRYKEFGYSQKSLGWGEKGKQEHRFDVLTSNWHFEGMRVLDVGAGFGDLYKFLKNQDIKTYHGVELNKDLVGKGMELYGGNENFKLTADDILEIKLEAEYDIVVISGLFNFKLINGNNYNFIESILKKVFKISEVGVASNFITDRVDYHEDLIFNANPEKILSIGLELTNNLSIRSDYFPFEFSLFLNKNQAYSKEDTIFNSYKNGK